MSTYFLIIHFIFVLFIFTINLNIVHAREFKANFKASYQDFAINLSNQSLSLDTQLKGSRFQNNIPKYQIDFLSYFEKSQSSEFYFDVPILAYRLKTTKNSFFTFGRFHPLSELDFHYSSNYLDAIGTNWGINEQNPFNIKNVGWVGLSEHFKISKKWKALVAFSPIFIPNMGPSVNYSNDKLPSSQSLFARTPPAKVRINEQTYLPLMISLDHINIKDIVLQNQAFIGLNYDNFNDFSFSLFAYSAPSPVATTSTKEKLIIKDQNVRILVDINPIFKRENNLGFNLKKQLISIQSLYKITEKNLSLSSTLMLSSNFKIGVLHTFHLNQTKSNSSNSLINPKIDQKLAWIDFESKKFYGFKLNSQLIKNFDQDNNGMNLRFGFNYMITNVASLYSQAQIFTGNDNSYYGAWRHLDFISTGVQAKW